MPSIYKYRKIVDKYTTHQANLPEDAAGNYLAQELCELDGMTYLSVADGVALPPQPEQVSVELVQLTDDLKAALKEASPHVRLIHARVVARIRERYTADDELKMARIAVGQLAGLYVPTQSEGQAVLDFAEWVRAARDWGVAQKAELGL